MYFDRYNFLLFSVMHCKKIIIYIYYKLTITPPPSSSIIVISSLPSLFMFINVSEINSHQIIQHNPSVAAIVISMLKKILSIPLFPAMMMSNPFDMNYEFIQPQ